MPDIHCSSCGMVFRASDVAGMEKCPVCGASFDGLGAPPKKKPPASLASILIVVIIFVVLVSIAPSEKEAPPANNLGQEIANLREKDRIAAVHSVTVYGIRDKSSNSSILILDIYVNNKSSTDLKDPVIACALTGASGTMIGIKNITLYRSLPRHSEIVAANTNLGFINNQTENIECKCLDAASVE